MHSFAPQLHSLNSHFRVSHTFCFCFLINKALHWCRSENFQINCQNAKTYQKRNFVTQFEVPVTHTPRLGAVTWSCVQWLERNLIDPRLSGESRPSLKNPRLRSTNDGISNHDIKCCSSIVHWTWVLNQCESRTPKPSVKCFEKFRL